MAAIIKDGVTIISTIIAEKQSNMNRNNRGKVDVIS